MELALGVEDAADWVYRGEGAENLVLAYTGFSPAFIGKVMRISKARKSGSKVVKGAAALTEHERLLWKDIDELIFSSSKEAVGKLFVQHVMKPLLGPQYVDPGMNVPVSREFLESVEKNFICQRPAFRVDTAQIDMHSDSVLLMSDHSLFPHGSLEVSPCISVEIKPKCGFLPLSRFISDETAIKKSVTRFKMHQVLKLQQGEISELSQYDPLDLFSGSKERIQKAMKDLFTTPQNNFRVFLNGSLIFGGLGGGAPTTNFLIAKTFEDALKSVIQAEDGLYTEKFLDLVAESLHKSEALDRLLKIQKFDNLDIEGAIHAYYNITSQQCMACEELNEQQLNRYASLHSASLEESLRTLKDYLIAATAKDCSLIICFRPSKEGYLTSVCDHVCVQSTKQTFDVKVSYIDLDLKPLNKMEYYYKLDKKIVSFYRQMAEMNQEMKPPTL
ncbi:inositol-pentakisphosphate 2-kinase [Neltuma alba]|uniref:inositol-pentakisphosphate 2-kinase n=1 Tax=Neltuma alba TaxID=207710 RepID=UPI0010A4F3C0|nr:inositol-pentakisphosphate 2-kinase-like [Prosopis alba]XP_028766328.1 inositol-pentakisphosphate 2-kinase-like [Prosopis alba]XP_028766335.1 inositol-pentakisphosphate 2-kinase-like [Prosopis alba]